MTTRKNSFLTGIECDSDRKALQGNSYYWDRVCGTYGLNDSIVPRLESNEWEKRHVAWILAQRNARGIKQPLLIVERASDSKAADAAAWSIVSLDQILKAKPRSSAEMMDEALLNLSATLKHPSEYIRLSIEDCWLVFAYNHESMAYILEQLCEAEFLKFHTTEGGRTPTTKIYTIRSKGWDKLARMRTSSTLPRGQAFVAMWFDPQTEAIFDDAIFPVVESDGTKCVRIDLKEHNNKICDEILAEIRRSRYMVADFTGSRAGVYFEAGFAYGLGIPVIWTVREDHLPQVHFDTRQYNHIVYKTPEELKKRLTNRIKATIPDLRGVH